MGGTKPLALPPRAARLAQPSAPTPTPVASTSTLPPAQAESAAPKAVRKKKQARGRPMNVKIFYSLASPRFTAPPAPSPQPSAAESPSFLAILDPSLQPPPTTTTSANPPASQPASAQQDQSTPYTCIARLSGAVHVQLVGHAPPQNTSSIDASDVSAGKKRKVAEEKVQEFGRITLKTCLGAIVVSRPELITDPTKDYAVSALDPYESSLQPSSANTSASNPAETRLMEGKGMLSWNLAEKSQGTTYVCGRVTGEPPRLAKKSKTEEEGEESDEEPISETLEIWLQLVERPAFTQDQFLTSLQSFANPKAAQQQSLFAQAISSPPRAPSVPIPAPSALGASLKLHRPTPALSNTAALPPSLAHLQEPQIVALLSQLLAPASSGTSSSTAPGTGPLNLDSDQGRALLPAIHTLAKFYGISIPANVSSTADLPSSSTFTAAGTAPSARGERSTTPSGAPTALPKASTSTAAAKADSVTSEPFPPLGVQVPNNLNPTDPEGGCFNCKRRKSQTWRRGKKEDGTPTTVCNACGTYYNKNNRHRKRMDRNQDPSFQPPPPPSQLESTSSSASTGRPLRGRLTATCEADLLKKASKQKKPKRSSAPGIVPPLSPSKKVGPPSRSPMLPGFRHAPYGATHRSSPGKSLMSPRKMTTLSFTAATSPIRRSGGATRGTGGSAFGYESDSEARGSSMDYATLFGLHQSPSPRKGRKVPSYLLTASPGTALSRILNDTNVDMNLLDMPLDQSLNLGPSTSASNGVSDDDDLGFFIRSSPEKENHHPVVPSSSSFHDTYSREASAHATTSTDAAAASEDNFDSLLSSLRRDFNARLSSNAVTAPSSPDDGASSPCVQPRTSDASPGEKGKAPQSCGRPAPSILDSFIDGLIPAYAHNSGDGTGTTPVSDSDAWTPMSAVSDLDQTIRLSDSTSTSTGIALQKQPYHMPGFFPLPSAAAATAARRPHLSLPNHITSDAQNFDFGSLPPSSPPALPSETFPTPSDMEGGVTPDESNQYQDAVASFMATLENRGGAPSAMTGFGNQHGSMGGGGGDGGGGGKVELDRSTVAHLLQMIQAQGAPIPLGHSPAPSPADEVSVAAKRQQPATGMEGQEGEKTDAELKELYETLFSGGGCGVEGL